MDQRMWQTLGEFDLLHSSHQWPPTNIVTWATLLSIVDKLVFKTQTLLETLRTRNQLLEESYVYSEVEHLSPSVGCARNKRQYPTVPQNRKLFLWMLDCAWMEYLLSTFWDVVIEMLRSTNNTARQGRLAQGNLCGTGDHSSKKTRTKTPTEMRKREVEQLSNVEYVPTNTHSSQGESQLYIFEDNEAVIKMII